MKVANKRLDTKKKGYIRLIRFATDDSERLAAEGATVYPGGYSLCYYLRIFYFEGNDFSKARKMLFELADNADQSISYGNPVDNFGVGCG